MIKLLKYSLFTVLLVCALTLLAWLSSPDPKFNRASFESEPLQQTIADPQTALTLAQYRNAAGEVVTLLVEVMQKGAISGIDLADLGAPRAQDPFAALAAVDADQVMAAYARPYTRRMVAIEQLLPSARSGGHHLGIGTNFPEHAEEANSESVFVFPKFGAATPARTTVAAPEGGLLDYEVELCLRFDRPIHSLADFDAAVKGLFLCADFTDRIALLEMADPDNLDSGYGFSDAKSGPGFFPSGPFLVIPKDLSSFVADTRMMTWLNDEARQDARGAEMTLDFRALAEKVLGEMEAQRFYYAGEFYKLAPNQRIEQDMVLMSGTSEGVIFTTPARHDYIEIALAYLREGGPWSGEGLMDIAIPVFIENERESGHFLKPGDTVTYRASGLGDIVVEITP